MSNEIFSYLGWAILPDLLSTNLQTLYYKLTIRTGDPVPQKGTARYIIHRRRIYIIVILCYLLYTLIEADWNVRRTGDFYAQLGVDHNVEEKTIQSRYRRLALQYHPDKMPQGTTDAQRVAMQQQYVDLQLARDTLVDPIKRFAYDRFGPTVTQWKQCKTIKDFVYVGLQGTIPFYIGSSILMVFLGWLGLGDVGKHWRYLALASFAAIELHTLTRPAFTFITLIPTLPFALLPSQQSLPFPLPQLARLANSIPGISLGSFAFRGPYLPFQALRVGHSAIIAFFIALNRLGPLLSAEIQRGDVAGAGNRAGDITGDMSDEAMREALGNVEKTVQTSCGEAARLLALELVPFRDNMEEAAAAAGDPGTDKVASRLNSEAGGEMRHLREKLKEWFVTNTIRNDKEVQEALKTVLEKRKRGPAGNREERDADQHL